MRAALVLLVIATAGAAALLLMRRRTAVAPDSSGLLTGEGDGSAYMPAPAAPEKTVIDWFLDMTRPRGIRNNNPGNVKRSASAWLGKVPHAQNPDAVFEQFVSPEYGIRVIAYLLLRYQRDKGKQTLRALIEEPGGWAPVGTDGNPSTYGDNVAAAVGLRETDYVDLFASEALLRGVVTAIIRFENGQQPYGAEVIAEGVRMARAAF